MSEKLHLPEAMLYEPNTILALEYLRSLGKLQKQRQPVPKPWAVRRQGAGHGDTLPKGKFASGTTLRQMTANSPDKNSLKKDLEPLVPPAVCQAIVFCKSYPDKAKIYQLLRYKLLSTAPQGLQQILGISEGLEQAMLQAINFPRYDEFVHHLTSRRYPSTRIQRLISHLLLSMNKELVKKMDNAGPLYLRVLAMDSTGRQLLRQIKNRGRLPLLNKVTSLVNRRDLLHPEAMNLAQQMLSMDIAATNLRSLALGETASLYEDYLHSPCYIEN